MDTQASLPTVDELIPLSSGKGTPNKGVRRAQLQEVLDEVVRLRTFVENTREQSKYVTKQIADLETRLRESEATHRRLKTEADQVRWQNVEFMGNALVVVA